MIKIRYDLKIFFILNNLFKTSYHEIKGKRNKKTGFYDEIKIRCREWRVEVL